MAYPLRIELSFARQALFPERHPGRYSEPGSIGTSEEMIGRKMPRIAKPHLRSFSALAGQWTPDCMASGITEQRVGASDKYVAAGQDALA